MVSFRKGTSTCVGAGGGSLPPIMCCRVAGRSRWCSCWNSTMHTRNTTPDASPNASGIYRHFSCNVYRCGISASSLQRQQYQHNCIRAAETDLLLSCLCTLLVDVHACGVRASWSGSWYSLVSDGVASHGLTA